MSEQEAKEKKLNENIDKRFSEQGQLKQELDKIKQEYLLLCDDFKNEMKFDPKNIYRFED